MLPFKTRWVILGAVCIAGSLNAADEPSARVQIAKYTSDAGAPAGAKDKEWHLTDFIKGTPEHIRGVMNGEAERLIGRINDTRGEIKRADKDCETDTKTAVDQLHQSALYKQTVADKKQAEADLAAARASGSAEDRIAASSRFNKARFAIEKMEKDAIVNCKPLLDDQRRSYEMGHEVKRLRDALDKALKWRSELLNAMRNGFAMRMPIGVGSEGALPKAVVEDVVDGDHVLVTFEAWMIKGPGKEEEGITKFYGDNQKVKILLSGIDTKGLRRGDTLDVDHVFVVEKTIKDEATGAVVFVAAPHSSDANALFDAVVPLRQGDK